MGVTSGGGVRGWAREFGDLQQVPEKTVTALDGVLVQMLAETQVLVHVITGELKGTGHWRRDMDGVTWSGEIVYGCPSDEDAGPAYYAIYEMARGGDHDWYRTLPMFDPMLEAAMLTAWDK